MSDSMLEVKILTAETLLFAGSAISVLFPGSLSAFEVLKNHAPIISMLGAGKIVVKIAAGETQEFAISAGVVRVDNNIVSACVEL